MRSLSILKLFLVIAVLPCASASFAQPKVDKIKVKVRMSADQEADARLMPYSIIQSDGNSIMMMRSGEFDVRAFGKLTARLDLYDRAKLTYVRSMEPVMRGKAREKLLLEDLVLFGGKPMLIARYNGEAEVALYSQTIDPNLTKPPPNFERFCTFPIELKEFKPLVVSAGSAMRSPFQVTISRDSTHMLVYSPEVRDAETDEAMYLMALVDRSMNVTWQNILRIPGNSNHTRLLDVELDDAGNGYVLVRNDFKGRDFVDGKPNFEIVLYRLSEGDIANAPFTLDPGYWPTGGVLEPLSGGRMACAGIYASSEEQRYKLLGNYVTIFEAGSAEMGQPTLMPFTGGNGLEDEGAPDEEEEEKPKEEEDATKQEKKDEKRMSSATDIIATVPRSDGGFFLVNEVNYARVSRNMQTGSSSTSYYHGPVQVRSFTKDGVEQWSTIYRRWTASGSPLLGRVFAAEFNDQLFLFMLDSDEMIERRKAGEKISPKHGREPYSVYVTFDDKGAYRTKAVLKSDTNKDYIGGWNLMRTGKAEYIALGTEKLVSGKFLPVKIEFTLETKK